MNTIFLRRVNIGDDAVVKEVEGQKVIEFSVAENRKYKDAQGNQKEATSWFKCSWWTSHTNIAEFLKKGASVNVIGKLSASAYLNKSNAPAVDLKVSVMELDLLDKKEKTEEGATPYQTTPVTPENNPDINEDLPF